MTLACLLLLALQNPDFSRAMNLVGEGSFLEAHELIETLPSLVDRAQAQVFLRLRAGDLPGAMHWAEVGTDAAPDDLWLAERRASIAISMGAHDRAVQAVEEFASALQRTGSSEASASLVGLQLELELMHAADEQRESALFRSRATVFGSLTVLLGLLFRLTRR